MDASDFINSGVVIGIFGCGVTGAAVAEFCARRGLPCRIFNEFGCVDDQFSEEEAAKYPLIIKSPSFGPAHKWVKLAIASGCHCMTELELASCFWQGKIVAITGTNGKTTTTEFVTSALRLCGKKAIACGNIGVTFIGVVDSDCNDADGWAVLEVSSFQMDGSKLLRPDYVLWINFADDHLDAHGGLREYFNCKAELIRCAKTSDRTVTNCFVGPSVRDFCEKLSADDILGRCVVCKSTDALPEDSVLSVGPQRENFALVQKFWECAGLPMERLREASLAFQLPPHRLQKTATVSKISGAGRVASVEFWNDSKATNFHALNAALGSFARPVILIAGGKSKDEPMDGFLKIIGGRIKALLLIGDVGETLRKAVAADRSLWLSIICKFFSREESVEKLMDSVVRYAFSLALDGDVVLLSPGFSSLDWFKNYEERGKFFEKSVLCLNLQSK
ncbi:MAG: UDP-N-acetylmuramoyl-L-alanine--D-glutamate ligase [Puniceicoccales bacterium]|jgi:UDP-N-acetylmuramoylalanine--D-glutamate ligase|nr:UDP-N-acetylmuramoyl-L-alanine--D-glutamate ligase [Puniceicoccales bacterium]